MIQSVANLLDPQCKNASFLQSKRPVFSASSIATVIRPWLGRHHVYGHFVLPTEHRLNYPVLLTVKSIGQFRRRAYMVKVLCDPGYSLQPDQYLVRVHLRTRLALFLMLKGRYWKLQDPMNWTLSYTVLKS